MTQTPDQPWYQSAFGAHYPLLYQHRNDAEARQCLNLLPQLAPLGDRPGVPLLDLGCGDGRHLQWLAAAGHEVVGLDLSAHLLALAKERHSEPPVPLLRGDMRKLPCKNDSMAAVLSLFTAFGYFGPPAANGEPVAEIARVLQRGAHWFLDYFDGDRVLAELGDGRDHVRERELACLRIMETRRYHADRRQVVKEVVLSPLSGCETEAAQYGIGSVGLRYCEQVAVFTLAELDELAQKQGLLRVAAAGSYDGLPLGQGPRWILVYRKEHDHTG